MSQIAKRLFARPYVQLHIAVFLFGFTAILGKEIHLSGIVITWHRLLITILSLCFFPGILKAVREIPRKLLYYILLTGILLAIHWATFFESIKYSNASITLSGMASTAFFTSFIEPIVFKRKPSWLDMMLALGIIMGFIVIFGAIPPDYLTGLFIALFSALIIAIASVMTKVAVDQYDVFAVTLLQFGAGWVFLGLIMPFYFSVFPEYTFLPDGQEWLYLLILALVCTTFAYTLFMKALRRLSAFITNLAINLEPVYGILMAGIFFREDKELNTGFYLGAGIIIIILFLHPILIKRVKNSSGTQKQ